MKPERILVVDDEPKIASVIESYLVREGLKVVIAHSGTDALRLVSREQFSLVILDLMLPDIPGEEICRRLRETSDTPVIMVTAKVNESDQLKGFRAGTDDYVTKPFSPRTLAARVAALLKRSGARDGASGRIRSFCAGELVIDKVNQEARRDGRPVDLTRSEFAILAAMAAQPGKTWNRAELLNCCPAGDGEASDRVIDSHIKNLRRKLEKNPKSPCLIVSVYGMGYRFMGGVDGSEA